MWYGERRARGINMFLENTDGELVNLNKILSMGIRQIRSEPNPCWIVDANIINESGDVFECTFGKFKTKESLLQIRKNTEQE